MDKLGYRSPYGGNCRWPGVVPVGIRTDAMVQFADVLRPLDVAGSTGDHQTAFDGKSFIDVLRVDIRTQKYVYGVHNNVPEDTLSGADRQRWYASLCSESATRESLHRKTLDGRPRRSVE